MLRLIGLNMNNSQSQNRRPRRSGNGTDHAMTKSEEHKALKEELNKVKEQISKLQEKLERTIHSKAQLLTLNCRLVEDLKMANMPLSQAYKVFEIRQKAELHQEIADLAILSKVTKADHKGFKNSFLAWLPALMQHQKSTEKDHKEKVSAKDSGLEVDIDTAPKISRDMQLLIAENQALKCDVETLKEQLKMDQQIRQGMLDKQMLQVNAEVQHDEAVDIEPISKKKDTITSDKMAEQQQMYDTVEYDSGMQFEDAIEPNVEQHDELISEKATKEEQFPEVTKTCHDAEVYLENAAEPEFGMPSVAEQQDKVSSETQFEEEVGKSEAMMQRDGPVDSRQDDKPVFEERDETKDETATVNVEEAVEGNIAIQDGSQSTGEEISAENMAKEQNMQQETAQKVTGDHDLILQEKGKIISELEAENACLQNVNKNASALAEELELDKLSSELSYKAILKGMKDNIELNMVDHQNEVQQFELKVKEEKKLREEEQAKDKALAEELDRIKLESKALKESQNAEIEKLREAMSAIESKYSKARDDFQEKTKRMQTALKARSTEMNDLTSLNAAQKHENKFLREKLARFSDKLDNETSLLRDQLTRYGDKLDKEEQIRKGLEERNAELYTRLQEQEDVISELQAKKRRRKGWRRFVFCF